MKKECVFKNQKGFTLIEIIAVLVILGILAAIAAPKYMAMQTDAKSIKVKEALAIAVTNYNNAYASFFDAYGNFPIQVTNTGTGATATCNFTGGTVVTNASTGAKTITTNANTQSIETDLGGDDTAGGGFAASYNGDALGDTTIVITKVPANLMTAGELSALTTANPEYTTVVIPF